MACVRMRVRAYRHRHNYTARSVYVQHTLLCSTCTITVYDCIVARPQWQLVEPLQYYDSTIKPISISTIRVRSIFSSILYLTRCRPDHNLISFTRSNRLNSENDWINYFRVNYRMDLASVGPQKKFTHTFPNHLEDILRACSKIKDRTHYYLFYILTANRDRLCQQNQRASQRNTAMKLYRNSIFPISLRGGFRFIPGLHSLVLFADPSIHFLRTGNCQAI